MSEKKKTSVEVPQDVDSAAQNAINKSAASGANRKQLILWMGALVLGGILGFMGSELLNEFFNFVATVFTKLFQAVAIPTIALSIITTLCKLGAKKNTGRIFERALTYTFLTTISAAAVGMFLYIWVAPENLPEEIVGAAVSSVPLEKLGSLSYYDHFLSVIPNNLLKPFIEGNVLSVVMISAAMGMGLAFMPKTENQKALVKALNGLQELLFTLIGNFILENNRSTQTKNR